MNVVAKCGKCGNKESVKWMFEVEGLIFYTNTYLGNDDTYELQHILEAIPEYEEQIMRGESVCGVCLSEDFYEEVEKVENKQSENTHKFRSMTAPEYQNNASYKMGYTNVIINKIKAEGYEVFHYEKPYYPDDDYKTDYCFGLFLEEECSIIFWNYKNGHYGNETIDPEEPLEMSYSYKGDLEKIKNKLSGLIEIWV